jgi:hypothetical protein
MKSVDQANYGSFRPHWALTSIELLPRALIEVVGPVLDELDRKLYK